MLVGMVLLQRQRWEPLLHDDEHHLLWIADKYKFQVRIPVLAELAAGVS